MLAHACKVSTGAPLDVQPWSGSRGAPVQVLGRRQVWGPEAAIPPGAHGGHGLPAGPPSAVRAMSHSPPEHCSSSYGAAARRTAEAPAQVPGEPGGRRGLVLSEPGSPALPGPRLCSAGPARPIRTSSYSARPLWRGLLPPVVLPAPPPESPLPAPSRRCPELTPAPSGRSPRPGVSEKPPEAAVFARRRSSGRHTGAFVLQPGPRTPPPAGGPGVGGTRRRPRAPPQVVAREPPSPPAGASTSPRGRARLTPAAQRVGGRDLSRQSRAGRLEARAWPLTQNPSPKPGSRPPSAAPRTPLLQGSPLPAGPSHAAAGELTDSGVKLRGTMFTQGCNWPHYGSRLFEMRGPPGSALDGLGGGRAVTATRGKDAAFLRVSCRRGSVRLLVLGDREPSGRAARPPSSSGLGTPVRRLQDGPRDTCPGQPHARRPPRERLRKAPHVSEPEEPSAVSTRAGAGLGLGIPLQEDPAHPSPEPGTPGRAAASQLFQGACPLDRAAHVRPRGAGGHGGGRPVWLWASGALGGFRVLLFPPALASGALHTEVGSERTEDLNETGIRQHPEGTQAAASVASAAAALGRRVSDGKGRGGTRERWGLTGITSVLTAEEPVNRTKTTCGVGGDACERLPRQGLVSEIHEELPKLNTRETNNPSRDGRKTWRVGAAAACPPALGNDKLSAGAVHGHLCGQPMSTSTWDGVVPPSWSGKPRRPARADPPRRGSPVLTRVPRGVPDSPQFLRGRPRACGGRATRWGRPGHTGLKANLLRLRENAPRLLPPPRGAEQPQQAQNELRGQSKALWVDASRPDSAGGHSGAGGHGGEDLGPVQRRPFLSAASCHNQGIRTSLSAVLRSTTGSSDARWASCSCPAGGHRGPRGQEGASALRISPSSGVCRDVGLQVPDPPAPQSFSLVNQNPREPAWESRSSPQGSEEATIREQAFLGELEAGAKALGQDPLLSWADFHVQGLFPTGVTGTAPSPLPAVPCAHLPPPKLVWAAVSQEECGEVPAGAVRTRGVSNQEGALQPCCPPPPEAQPRTPLLAP
ncbi:collagen alpha-1(I) chain-like [Canis lupus familiaris]|uniref:collagen alpha-1(I) chain-like n=1 Tax=Canis lupus familiaris TaxID=9615 RepID=UPI0018F63524|nr:collagen alpha-1(I) chain-like [Canis lupus familiaris]